MLDGRAMRAIVMQKQGNSSKEYKMKNQYFGDINDFRKYIIIKGLAEAGMEPISIIWMLTEDIENNKDGRKIKYIDTDKYKNIDSELYSILTKNISNRNVSVIENSNYFRNVTYFNELVPYKEILRREWFERVKKYIQKSKLVFFDPDNGIEIKSIRKNSPISAKYIYWSEIEELLNNNISILIYQHFSREKRDAHIKRIAKRIFEIRKNLRIIIFRTPHTFFLLIVPNSIKKEILALLEHFKNWNENEIALYIIESISDNDIAILPAFYNNKLEYIYYEYIESMNKFDFSELLSLIPEIENINKFYKIREGSIHEHSLSFPLYEEDKIIQKFRDIAYNLKIVIPFNWMKWKEGEELYNRNIEYLDLDIITLCKLITAIIRNDRFCEGFLIDAFENRKILKLLYAIKANFDEDGNTIFV